MAAARNYKEEYAKFHSSPKAIAKRGGCNEGRKKLGLKVGDTRDASETKDKKGKTIWTALARSKNRGSNSNMPGDRKARGKGVKKNQPKKVKPKKASKPKKKLSILPKKGKVKRSTKRKTAKARKK